MTKDKFLELYGGWIGFLVISIGMFFVPIDFYDYKAIIDSTPEVSISIFGILLAFMGIILQGQNKTINEPEKECTQKQNKHRQTENKTGGRTMVATIATSCQKC